MEGTGGAGTGGTWVPGMDGVATGGAATGGTGGADAGTAPATGGAIADAAPADGTAPDQSPALQRICSGGGAKVGVGDKVADTPATAYRLDMASCCAARYGILFHSHDRLGNDFEVAVMQVDATIALGTYQVSEGWRPLHVVVRSIQDPAAAGRVATGTVRITDDPAAPAPFQLGLCLESPAGDAGEPALMFYLPNIFVAPEAWAGRLRIVPLQDPTVSSDVLATQPLDSFVLAQTPLLELGSITSVNETTGEIRVLDHGDFGKRIRDLMSSYKILLLPFVVEADGARVYLGQFVSPLSSFIGPGPFVDTGSMGSDRFTLELVPGSGADPRWDDRIIKVLAEANRLL